MEEGKEIHYHTRTIRLEFNIYVGTALVNLYGKFGPLKDAHDVFDKISREMSSLGHL
jgi:hypothetical protein